MSKCKNCTLRTLIIRSLYCNDPVTKGFWDKGWMDYSYKRGDRNASSFKNYGEWLESLDDEELLAAYKRVEEVERELD